MGVFKNLGTVVRQSAAGVLLRGFFQAAFLVVAGMTFPDAIAYLMQSPPLWLTTWWFRLLASIAVVVVGLIALYFRYGYARATKRQQAIDSLSRDISEAIHDLLNRHTRESITDTFLAQWERDYQAWCQKVSDKLKDRNFFTESDQLHFDRLGIIPTTSLTNNARLDWLINMLGLKFERLRDIIRAAQERPL